MLIFYMQELCRHYRKQRHSFNDTKFVKERFKGIQANTSPLSYSELDGSLDLKCSEPEDFSDDMIKLSRTGAFQIWGGCCGTDKSKYL